MHTFNSYVHDMGSFEDDWDQDTIKNEPMLFNCDLSFAYTAGGSLTKSFIETLPQEWVDHKPVVDSRVHMLMPSWYSCIPGWHHDNVPRNTPTGQPNYTNPEYQSVHLMGLVNGDICPTRFKIESIQVPEVLIECTIYEEWSNYIDANPQGTNYLAESGRYLQFDCNAFHEGTKAVASSWCWFIRLSHNTHRQRKSNITNEIRRQVQVYLEYPKAGW